MLCDGCEEENVTSNDVISRIVSSVIVIETPPYGQKRRGIKQDLGGTRICGWVLYKPTITILMSTATFSAHRQNIIDSRYF